MTIDKDKSFGVDNGIIISDNNGNEGPFITGGPSSPVGLDLPVDAIYYQSLSNGVHAWEKFGAGANDWRRVTRQSNTIHVDPNGDDTFNDGSVQKPYATLTGAYNSISVGNYPNTSSDKIAIVCGAGDYTQAPVDFSSLDCELVIMGKGTTTRFIASNANSDLLTLGGSQTIIGIALEGITNTSNWLLRYSETGFGVASVTNLLLRNASNGMTVSTTASIFRVTANSLLSTGVTGTILEANSNSSLTLNGISSVGNGSTTVGLRHVDDAEIITNSARFTSMGTGVKLDGNSGSVSIQNIALPSCVVSLDQNGTVPLKILGGNVDATTASIVDASVIEGYFINEVDGENQFRLFSELSVGLPNNGKESVMGEGDSYTLGQQVWTYNGTTYTDVSSDAGDQVANSFTFPNTSTNTAIYFSTAFDTSNPIKWYGLKLNTTTASVLGSGDIVFEYWNGTAWTEFNHMITQSSAPYLSHANEKFERVENNQVRFDPDISMDWSINDPVSLGVNLYWMRMRIDTGITTAPVFLSSKIHTSRLEVNADGFQEMFGDARVRKKFPITFGGFQASAASPANRDVYLSDRLGVGRIENDFQNNTTDRTGFVQYLPFDIDTSSSLSVEISYLVDANSSGNIDFTLRWGTSIAGDGVYETTSQAPTTAPNERSLSGSVPVGSNERRILKTFSAELEIPEAISRNDGNPASLLWVTIERDGSGDTYSGNASIIELALYYESWNEGGYTRSS